MLSREDRIFLTIAEIEYSDAYEMHQKLFDKGIEILKSCDGDFSDEDRETLEEIFAIIGCENDEV